MAMKNPPRRTTIKGQPHLLAYITPEEADVLKAMGGSGEKVHGIPAYPRSGGSYGGGGRGGRGGDDGGFDGGANEGGPDNGGGGSFGGGNDGGGGGQSDEDLDQSVQQDLAAAAAAAQGVDLGGYQYDAGFDSTARGTARDVYDTMMAIRTATGMSSPAARDQIMGYALGQLPGRRRQARNLMSFPVSLFGKTYRVPSIVGSIGGLLSNFNLSNIERTLQNPNAYPAFDTTGKLQGAYSPGLFGFGEVYTGNRPNDPMFDDGRGRDDTVPASYNPNTGEAQCPDGYMFDEDLQACRLAGGLPGGDGGVVTTPGPYEAGDYARMGLLDIAPMGTGMFAERYGAGFGTPQDFSAANLAFRRGAATRPQYFRQAPDLTGYTLLS